MLLIENGRDKNYKFKFCILLSARLRGFKQNKANWVNGVLLKLSQQIQNSEKPFQNFNLFCNRHIKLSSENTSFLSFSLSLYIHLFYPFFSCHSFFLFNKQFHTFYILDSEKNENTNVIKYMSIKQNSIADLFF